MAPSANVRRAVFQRSARPSRNSIRQEAVHFVADWKDETSERAEAQSFWTDFLRVFGVERRRVKAAFERHAQRTSTGRGGFIDLLWPNMLLAEHKSQGEDLEKAMGQALDYIDGLSDTDLPRMVVVSDFARFRVLNLETNEREQIEFAIEELPRRIDLFIRLAGYTTRRFEDQDAVNVEAAAILGQVYEELAVSGYPTHELGIVIVRLLFLLFGDNTGLWSRNQFADLIDNHTDEDGSDLGFWIGRLFEVLDTPVASRNKALNEDLAAFPYVNGGLFREHVSTPDTTKRLRYRLMKACQFDWSQISPAIFGSIFQSVMDDEERRQLGAHYTTEKNIMKVLTGLCLDNLETEFLAAITSPQRLRNLHDRISRLTFFDPACGCGNFLVIAYRQLRRLERRILLELNKGNVQLVTDISVLRKVKLENFHGIEIEEFPVRIAETAMYLADHLENEALGLAFGHNIVDLPLTGAADIRADNALRMDWNDVLPRADCTYLLGNPPFRGKKIRTAEQQADMGLIFGSAPGTGDLDYVTAWYEKSIDYIRGLPTKVAFVSTNSITQGEQVPVLWSRLLDAGIDVGFAHRTFAWTSEAKGKAAVHCVILGYSHGAWAGVKHLYDYPTVKADPVMSTVTRINPYLLDAPVVLVTARRDPLVPSIPRASFGSMPNDSGFLLLDDEEANEIRATDPVAASYIRPLASARQLLHGVPRWCLWLENASPTDIRRSAVLRERVSGVEAYRLQRKRAATLALAGTPHLFGERRQPVGPYLCIPRHAGQSRSLIPMFFFDDSVIASDSTVTIPKADLYLFGMLQSATFTAWQETVGGRLKSDLRFSIENVYNNFPFPEPTDTQRDAVAEGAQAVLDAREAHREIAVGDLYDHLGMPLDLVRAHRKLDIAVDHSFGRRAAFRTDTDRLRMLFERYEELSQRFTPSLPIKRTGGRGKD